MATQKKIWQLVIVMVLATTLNECLASPATQPQAEQPKEEILLIPSNKQIVSFCQQIRTLNRETVKAFLNGALFLIVGMFYFFLLALGISERRRKKKDETLLKNLKKACGDKKNFEGLPSKILVKATRQYKRERSLIKTIRDLEKEEFSSFFSDLGDEDVVLLGGMEKEDLIAFAKELDKPQLLRLLEILHHLN